MDELALNAILGAAADAEENSRGQRVVCWIRYGSANIGQFEGVIGTGTYYIEIM